MAFTSLALASLLGLARSTPAKPGPVSDAFEEFVRKYGRQYASKEEQQRRFSIFETNYAFVLAENAKGRPYRLAVNEFADQEREELRLSGRLGLSAPAPGLLWAGLPHLGTHNYSGEELPAAVDWTTKGAVTNPKNQKKCGACWAFSTTGALEGAWAIAGGGLLQLSEQQLVDCAHGGNHGCNGGAMDPAFRYLEAHSMCTEQGYPYEAKEGTCREASCGAGGIPRGAILGFRDVARDNEQALMEAVAKQPVSVGIEADQLTFQLYSGGVLTKKCDDKLDHGVLVVGYGIEDGVKYWKVKNSWGPGWGEHGFVRLERGESKEEGECGINLMASYPVVEKAAAPSLIV